MDLKIRIIDKLNKLIDRTETLLDKRDRFALNEKEKIEFDALQEEIKLLKDIVRRIYDE